jgi:hypothetical protein
MMMLYKDSITMFVDLSAPAVQGTAATLFRIVLPQKHSPIKESSELIQTESGPAKQ